jgi:hypothetical protein
LGATLGNTTFWVCLALGEALGVAQFLGVVKIVTDRLTDMDRLIHSSKNYSDCLDMHTVPAGNYKHNTRTKFVYKLRMMAGMT